MVILVRSRASDAFSIITPLKRRQFSWYWANNVPYMYIIHVSLRLLFSQLNAGPVHRLSFLRSCFYSPVPPAVTFLNDGCIKCTPFIQAKIRLFHGGFPRDRDPSQESSSVLTCCAFARSQVRPETQKQLLALYCNPEVTASGVQTSVETRFDQK